MRALVKGSLRCEGPGTLKWGEDPHSLERVAIRVVPLAANGEVALDTLVQLPVHPRLPALREVGFDDHDAFAIVDFPRGRLLSHALMPGLDARRLMAVGAQISDALAAAHAHGIAHGELCMESILVRRNGEALLWDLPWVVVDREVDRRDEGRALKKLQHTAEFLAPECARGAGPGAPADVWSLGAVLCRVAGGMRPQAANTLGILHQIATGTWAPEVPERLPEGFRLLLSRMLHPDPSLRPTARAVSVALADLLRHLPAQPTAPTDPLEVSEEELAVRPQAPRSAWPDSHSVPTLNDDGVELENALDQAIAALAPVPTELTQIPDEPDDGAAEEDGAPAGVMRSVLVSVALAAPLCALMMALLLLLWPAAQFLE